MVENLTRFNALEGKIWKSDQKGVMDEKINLQILMDERSWKTWKSNQKSVMNEEVVQNSVMNEEVVQNGVMDGKFVMNAKIDPMVVMDLSIFKIGGWNSQQPINQNLLEEFIDEERTLVVDRNSKQRSLPGDTVLGTTLCEFRSAHEEIDVTS